MREIVMTDLQAGMRLDHFLERALREAHTGFIYKMLRKKNITLNGHKAHGNEKLEAGDVVRLYFAEETLEKFCAGAVPGVEAVPGRNRAVTVRNCAFPAAYPRDSKNGEPGGEGSGRGGRERNEKVLTYPDFPSSVRILYEDEHVLLVSKPAGMLTQKAKPGDLSLNEYAIGHLIREGAITQRELQTVRPSVCNRLDRNTSGIVAIGKTVRGLQTLSALFRDRTVSKHYQALVCGKVKSSQRIDGWLIKDARTNTVRILNREEKGAQRIRTSYTPEQAVCLTMTCMGAAGKGAFGGADGADASGRRSSDEPQPSDPGTPGIGRPPGSRRPEVWGRWCECISGQTVQRQKTASSCRKADISRDGSASLKAFGQNFHGTASGGFPERHGGRVNGNLAVKRAPGQYA